MELGKERDRGHEGGESPHEPGSEVTPLGGSRAAGNSSSRLVITEALSEVWGGVHAQGCAGATLPGQNVLLIIVSSACLPSSQAGAYQGEPQLLTPSHTPTKPGTVPCTASGTIAV